MIQYVLDSDHLSLYQRGYEPLKAYFTIIPPENIAITIISVEELIRGRLAQVHKASRSEDRVRAYGWLQQTLDFLCNFTVVMYSPEAEAYFQALREQKIRIGSQDLKIGAIALSLNAVLVTRNKRDFVQIPNLKIEDWTKP